MMTQINGYDISYAQGLINWTEFAPHTDFVIMRATSAQAGLHTDSRYSINLGMARSHKVPVWSYHFGYGIESPETEAAYYVSHNERRNGEGQVLDFEGRLEHITDPVEWALRWLDKVHSLTHNRPLIYMNQSTHDAHNWQPVVDGNFGLIVARWGTTPPSAHPWPFWACWQDSNSERVSGISGPVDSDIFNGNELAFIKYGENE